MFIGLMSGTSVDAVDGVLVDFPPAAPPRVLAYASREFDAVLREQMLALNRAGENELHRAALAANALADLYAGVVSDLLATAGVEATAVRAIGAHGQTVRHQPAAGYTLQLNAPARLAETTGIAVVADLRSRDVAAGGQGAPLACGLHQAVFGGADPVVVLNLGGMANITVLPGRGPGKVIGFDTGPANALLDLWCQRHTGAAYDAGGAFAAQGQVDAALLAHFVASTPWLAVPPPKSTGRDDFHAEWLDKRLAEFTARRGAEMAPADVQATLVAFTACTVADAIGAHAPGTTAIYVGGGGAANPVLMDALRQALQPLPVEPTDALGVPAQQVEALAFAWLAHAHVEGLAGNLPDVTGARGPRVLGALYPA
ncbi:anhydro-N-acetylmuramic acid kinase [Achromobacter sp. GG226]|uniref:anhydro-N-acetylmuramic acid kinase n=1 Tax=Verticiella alkaliphila TaxID=2779529 RepID=UPI001C0B4FB2|nr:anhydro-N-acetylmuramic acid kinase [Verticiella sp. GG226]MBU4611951.1 anhydro-N-acetylmuramic acid kinase [Verticiella sp. GG226]